MLRLVLLSLLGLLLSLPLLANAAAGSTRYADRQLIVKFKSEGDHALEECVHSLLSTGRSFRDVTVDHSDSLDGLRQRLGMRRARALFRKPDGRSFREQRLRLRQRFERSRARQWRRARRGRPSAPPPDLSHVYLVELSGDVAVERAVSLLRRDPHVEYAQPNFAVESDSTPNDPYYASTGSWGQDFEDLWGLHRIEAGSAWELSQGEGIVVAVVDGGLDYDHPDIAGNVWINPGEDLNGNDVVDESDYNGVDDDGNGYVDDLRGFDFYSSIDANQDGDFDDPDDVSDSDPFDDTGHGSHVAGTIAAVGDNGVGIVGVAPRARIMALKSFGANGPATWAGLVQAMVYAVENGADVINNSWSCGGRCPENPVAEEAVELAHREGLVVVTSAGNSGDDILLYSPEKLRETIAVGASNRRDELSSFSSFGLLMDVVAPGGGPSLPSSVPSERRNILSLLSSGAPSSAHVDGVLRVGDDYLRMSGTSMSAPHVAGLAALILARHPEFSNDDVRRVLRLTADDLGTPGLDRFTGSGRINAARAVALDALPRMRVEIASPRQGSTVRQQSGVLEISGSVSGEDLAEYSLWLGRGFDPGEWTPLELAQSGPVTEGAIARWSIGELEDGLYALKLVATAYDGTRFEEFLFVSLERNAPTPVSSEGEPAVLPAISGDLVVWQSERSVSEEGHTKSLFLTDLRDGSEYEIATGLTADKRASISGTDIVWSRPDELSIYTCRFERETGSCPEQWVATASDWISAPDISQGRIVWSEYYGGEIHLFWCEVDAKTGACPAREVVPEGAGVGGGDPQIDGLRLLWRDLPDQLATCELNPLTGECRAQPVFEDLVRLGPILGGGNLIVWEEMAFPEMLLRLCEYDWATGECPALTITPLPFDEDYMEPKTAISGRRVVWNATSESGNADIYFCEYDRVTQRCPPQRLTGNAVRQRNPAVDADRVVWEDERNTVYEIAMLELPSLRPIGDRSVAEGEKITIRIAARDPAGGRIDLDARLANGEALETIGARLQLSRGGRVRLRWSPDYGQAGSYAITVTATTSGRLRTGETFRIEVLDLNAPPVAIAGRSRTAVTRVLLNGCRSFDPEGEPLSYAWRDGGGRELGTSCRLRLEGPSEPGLESYVLSVDDGTSRASDRVWILWLPRSARRDLPWWWRLFRH